MKRLGGTLLGVALALASAPAHAQDDVAAFYRGKQIRLIVGSGAGGGYDLFARAVARHMGNHMRAGRRSSCKTRARPAVCSWPISSTRSDRRTAP